MHPPAINVRIPIRIPIKGTLKLYFFSELVADIIPMMMAINMEIAKMISPRQRNKIPNPLSSLFPKLPTSNNFMIIFFQ